MHKKRIFIGSLIVAAMLLSGCDYNKVKDEYNSYVTKKQEENAANPAQPDQPQQDQPQQNEQPAPNNNEPEQPAPEEPEQPIQDNPQQNIQLDTNIMTTGGETVNVKATDTGYIFQGYEGKVVIIEVFAWWCPDCKATVPVLNSIQAKYGDRLAVFSFENEGISNAEVQNYDNENGVEFKTIAKENSGNLVPFVKNRDGWRGEVPFIVIVDTNGNTYRSMSGTGEISEASLDSAIGDLL